MSSRVTLARTSMALTISEVGRDKDHVELGGGRGLRDSAGGVPPRHPGQRGRCQDRPEQANHCRFMG